MPSLKQLTCHIEWGSSNVPFKEYGTVYGDGVVESYIEVPSDSTPFSISLKSHGYISSGLAMFVFADGVYHCNRNRGDLKWPNNPVEPTEADRKQCEVNFRVRQREEHREGEVFAGRQWRFEPLNLVEPNSALSQSDSTNHFKYLGTTQVVVLRCTLQPDDKETLWDAEFLRRSLSPESATAPVVDCEDNDPTAEWQGKKVKQPDSLWAIYDGPGDTWETPNRDSGRYNRSKRKERKRLDPDHGSQASFRSNPSIVVNVHNYSQDTGSDWRSRPLSPETQRNSGCYNIENGRRVQGSRDWQQEQSPSEDSRASDVYENHSQPEDTGRDQGNNDEPSGWNSQSQENGWGDYSWQNNPENNQEHDDGWDNSGNEDNDNWGEDKPTGGWGQGCWGGNYETSDKNVANNWADGDNENRVDENNWGNNHDGNNWSDDGQDKARADDDWTRSDRGWNNANGNDNSVGWENDVNGQHNDQGNIDPWAIQNNDKNDAWGNDDNGQNKDQGNTDQWDNQNNDYGNGWGNDNIVWTQNGNQNDHGNDNVQHSSRWGEEDKNVNVHDNPRPPLAPIQHQAYQYRPPRSHGDFPNRSLGTMPSAFVTPRLVQVARNDEPLLYTVPVNVAQEMLTTHQVQPGASAAYSHRIATPDYIDSFEKPYAMFIFKYRQKEVIEKKLGINLERDIELERTKLERLPRETIVEQLLRAQGYTTPPTHGDQNEKPKWRPVFPLPNDFTTTPANPYSPGANGLAPPQREPQPSNLTYTQDQVRSNTGEAAWGAPEVARPAPSAYNPNETGKPLSERSHGRERTAAPTPKPVTVSSSAKKGDWSRLPPPDASTLGSAANGDWSQPPPPNPSAPGSAKNGDYSEHLPVVPSSDPFMADLIPRLNAATAGKHNKRSTTSKDSWATRTTADAKQRDLSRQNKSIVSNAGHRRSGSQTNNSLNGRGATTNSSRKSGSSKDKIRNEMNTSQQGGVIAGPWQTYRPSDSSSRRSQRNENNNSSRSGGWRAQGSSGNIGGGASTPGVVDAETEGGMW